MLQDLVHYNKNDRALHSGHLSVQNRELLEKRNAKLKQKIDSDVQQAFKLYGQD